MEYRKYIIRETKEIIKSKKSIIIYRTENKYFTRDRKMNFEKVVMHNLNKKGLTSKMEIVEFDEIVNSKDITSVGVLKQKK